MIVGEGEGINGRGFPQQFIDGADGQDKYIVENRNQINVFVMILYFE